MTLVPQSDNKLQRHLVSKFKTKKKISCDSAEIWYGGQNLAQICAYQISAKSGTKKFLLFLLWLLKPQMNIPLIIIVIRLKDLKLDARCL